MSSKQIRIEWNDKLSVGVDSIDNQHKILVKIINELFDSYFNHYDGTTSIRTMSKLMVYIHEHFKYEEELFDKYQWPQRNAHKNTHAILTKKVLDLKAQLDKDHDMENSLKLMELLKEWLAEHILVEDQKYAEFLRSKNIT
jgi:hemerythrin-like metal-binding protein